MKTKLKSIISGLLCAMLTVSVASAASLDGFNIVEDEVQRKLTVYGTPEGTGKGEGIRIEILKKDMQSSDIADSYTKAEMKENFVLIKQVPADENGGYSVTANMKDRPSGYYVVRVNGVDNEVYFSTNADRQALVDEIKLICTKGAEESEEDARKRATEELAAFFELGNKRSTTVISFNLTDEVVFKADDKGIAGIFYTIASDVTVNNFVEKIEYSAYVTALNEGKINIVDYKDDFELDEDYVKAYEEYITEENKLSFVDTYFKGKKYENNTSIKEAFKKAVLDSWCSYFESWGDVETYIDDFGEAAGVDTDKFEKLSTTQKSKLYLYIAGLEGFDSLESFETVANKKINELLSEKPQTSGGSSGGGGGGGGGSSSGSGGAAGATTVTPGVKPIETVPTDPNAEKEENPSSKFSDMKGFDWAKEAVDALAEAGIANGTGEGKYEPERNVKREEILVMLLRAFEIEIGEEVSDFSDAAADGWYNAYLAAAKKNGYISGRPDGSFGVGDSVTREDAAVMAYTIAKAMGKEFDITKTEAFNDEAEMSDYATDAIYALKNAEVINGKGEGKFDPKATCTRAEAAKIIYTLIK